MSFADQLKKISDSCHDGKKTEDVQFLYDMLIKTAKANAITGSYQAEIYDDRLLNADIAEALTEKLKQDGLRVSIAVDDAYTRHAGRTMIYCRVNWD